MTTRLARRVLQYLLVIFVATTLNFVIPLAMPGDPLKAILGENIFGMSHEQIAQARTRYGIDLPIPQQYLHYLGRLARFDLGYSYRFKQPIAQMILDRLPWTLSLTFSCLLVSVIVGSALGAWSAWRRGSASDIGLLTVLLGLQSLPAFWLAMMLIAVFAVRLRWLPVYGGKSVVIAYTGLGHFLDLLRHWLLPAATLILVSLPGWFLTMRYSMLGTLHADFIRTARAKGVSERRVMFRHAMRNALLPVFTNLMLGLAYSLSGATLIETVFSYPGLGRMLFEAVLMRDYPVIQATFLVLTLAVVAANLLADLIYPLLDPRVRTQT